LLADGCDELSERVRLLAHCDKFTSLRTELTGGRDSRLVYGAIIAGDCLDAYQIHSAPATNETYRKDLEVSLKLTSAFGGSYWAEDTRKRFEMSGLAARDAAVSFQAGTYRHLGASTRPTLGRSNHSLRLSGGAGELYRATYWETFGFRQIWATGAEDQYLSRVRSSILAEKKVLPAIADEVGRVFEDSIRDCPGRDDRMRVENHYAFFRNRMHFGCRDLEMYLNEVMWCPLDSLSLMRAARGIDFTDYAEVQCQFDILNQLAPALNFAAYDGGYWSEKILQKSSLFHIKEQLGLLFGNPDISEKRDEWQKTTESRVDKINKSSSSKRPDSSWRHYEEALKDGAREVITIINDTDPLLRNMLSHADLNDFPADLAPLWERDAAKLLEIFALCFDSDPRTLLYSDKGEECVDVGLDPIAVMLD